MNNICYRIQAGMVSELDIPADGLELPVSRRWGFRQPVAMPGAEDDECRPP
jgi:hypothetical protein